MRTYQKKPTFESWFPYDRSDNIYIYQSFNEKFSGRCDHTKNDLIVAIAVMIWKPLFRDAQMCAKAKRNTNAAHNNV